MDFSTFTLAVRTNLQKLIDSHKYLYVTNTDADQMYNLYLDSFLPGTNEIYIERRAQDCSQCRHFIKNLGSAVVINDDYTLTSIWDLPDWDLSKEFAVVAKALSKYVKSKPIQDIYVTHEKNISQLSNTQILTSGDRIEWHHFSYEFAPTDKQLINKTSSIAEATAVVKERVNILNTSLSAISVTALETVLELINSSNLYKGDEYRSVVTAFLKVKKEFSTLRPSKQAKFLWKIATTNGRAFCGIKYTAIGTLLVDISNFMSTDNAVNKFESMVAGPNFKRVKPIYTEQMLAEGKKAIVKLGFENSLQRRFANLSDVGIGDVLHVHRSKVTQLINGLDVFESMKPLARRKNTSVKEHSAREVSITKFLDDILPSTSSMELLLENKLIKNMVSLITAKNPDSPSMFPWSNTASWAYSGNITDSFMKTKVAEKGGNVKGVLRYSMLWNEQNESDTDLDAHCVEPNGNHINFQNARQVHRSSGVLDVDIQYPKNKDAAVENIVWTNISLMPEGTYTMSVNNYAKRGRINGFKCEIEFNNETYYLSYPHDMNEGTTVDVAKVTLKDGNFTINPLVDCSSETMSSTVWNLKTNKFHPVTMLTTSPNYWGQNAIGHKHYFFMLENAINDEEPNGFFNEFLVPQLLPHKRVCEALGAKMKVESTENQLSGVGFSSTSQNSVTLKVTSNSNTTQLIKVNF